MGYVGYILGVGIIFGKLVLAYFLIFISVSIKSFFKHTQSNKAYLKIFKAMCVCVYIFD